MQWAQPKTPEQCPGVHQLHKADGEDEAAGDGAWGQMFQVWVQ